MRNEQQLTAMLVPFYLGDQPDARGRKIQAMWTWDFTTLEETHDYIQWLFPISEKSAFNPNAPLVTDEVIQAFQANAQLRQNLRRSLTLMLQFYGFQLVDQADGTIRIEPSDHYPIRKREWMQPFNHNYLRLTRILKCLMLFGLEAEAHALYDCLQQIYQENCDRIGGETFRHWTKAVQA